MKQLLVILCITAAVWLGLAMSEEKEYPLHVRIEATGYDTLRYALVSADTAIDVRLRVNGFSALGYSLFRSQPVCKVAFSGEGERMAAGSDVVAEALESRFPGMHFVEMAADSLRLLLAPRGSRRYKPSIDQAVFSFAEHYGLYGNPVVSPAEVVLYGSEASLKQIDGLSVAKASFDGIHASGTYRLPLEPVWEQVPGVTPSCTSVEVFLPVESYVEQRYVVPVTVAGADSAFRYRIYPPQVTVSVWIAERDLHLVPQLSVTIDYADVCRHSQRLVPTLASFPSYVRPRSVEPAEVQCIVIR